MSFWLIPSTHELGPRFSFSPVEGKLGTGQSTPIEITFNPDSLGEFAVNFDWNLVGYLFLVIRIHSTSQSIELIRDF